MSSFVNIPSAQWRNLLNEIHFIKESLKVMSQTSSRTEWIAEDVAMQSLGIKDKRTMRKLATANSINFTCSGNRKYQYLNKDLKNYLLNNSTIAK